MVAGPPSAPQAGTEAAPPKPRTPLLARLRPHLGRLVLGAFALVGGIAWLLDLLGAVSGPWRVLLPSFLIVLGLALLFEARSGLSHGGLVTLGILLALMLTVGTAVDVPLSGGVGVRHERPKASGVHDYELAAGSITVDLTHLPAGRGAPPTTIRARVGMGLLVVLVPKGVPSTIVARAGVGLVTLFGDRHSGFKIRGTFDAQGSPSIPFVLDLTVGVGEVKVRYA